MQAEQTTTYNGWTNYATWGVALVLDNDQGTYNAVREFAEESREDEFPVVVLADKVQSFTEILCGLEGDDADDDTVSLSLMARQVLQAGLAEVNWREIAENVLSES